MEKKPDTENPSIGRFAFHSAAYMSLIPLRSLTMIHSAEPFFKQPVYSSFEKILISTFDVSRVIIPIIVFINSPHLNSLKNAIIPTVALTVLLFGMHFTAMKNIKFPNDSD